MKEATPEQFEAIATAAIEQAGALVREHTRPGRGGTRIIGEPAAFVGLLAALLIAQVVTVAAAPDVASTSEGKTT